MGQTIAVRMTASGEMGRVRGVVTRGGRPVVGLWVLLAADPSGGDPSGSISYLTDSDGSFDFEHVRAGEYLLFTAEDSVEYTNPAVVRQYEGAAKRIRVEPHAVLTENIALDR
jgi:hypothetical protein